MNVEKIKESLTQLFYKEGHRLVFWYDVESSFEETLPKIGLHNSESTDTPSDLAEIKLIRLDEVSKLGVKILLEKEDSQSKYLIYAPYEEPPLEENWLLDIQLYSRQFRANQVEIWLNELGLEDRTLRTYLKSREDFLKNKERFNQFKKLLSPSDKEPQLELKMMAVVVKASEVSLEFILGEMFQELANQSHFSLDADSEKLKNLEKLGLVQSFWDLINEQFEYKDKTPTLKKLLYHLFSTDLFFGCEYSNRSEVFQPILPFVITTTTPSANIRIFLKQWRRDIQLGFSYQLISKVIAEELKVESLIKNIEFNDFQQAYTFELLEQYILSAVRDLVLEDQMITPEALRSLIEIRKDGYWANQSLSSDPESCQYRYYHSYKALLSACELFSFLHTKLDVIQTVSSEELFQIYSTELYQIDACYRSFYELEREVALKGGGDLLKTLKQNVDDVYANGFLKPLSKIWGNLLDVDEKGSLQSWQIKGIANQYYFFDNFVQPVLKKAPKNKVYVIISDAFRYEAAMELKDQLSATNRFKATIEPLLGVLPSYTALGKAALLPHKSLGLKPNNKVNWLVDDKPCASTEERSKILGDQEGVAIQAEDLIRMKRDEARDFVRQYRVIYIYHDQIDKKGDKAPTESEAFSAVRTTINELNELTKKIINNLSGHLVLITSDHGFLYQETPPDETDRSKLQEKPEGTVLPKKRYLLGHQLPTSDQVYSGNTATTAKTSDSIDFWLPRGNNLFHFSGGARFFHGGTSLQEVMVPMISVKQLRGEAAQKAFSSKVDVKILGGSHRIVTNRHRFEFVQAEAVSDRKQPRQLLIGIWESSNLISNEEQVTFDSSSDNHNDRIKSVSILLKSGSYPKSKQYHLVLKDSETKVEYERVSVIIDISFSNDF